MSKANYGKYVELMGDRALDESVWRKLKYISFAHMDMVVFDTDALPDGIEAVNLNDNDLGELVIPSRLSGIEIISAAHNRLEGIVFEGTFDHIRVLNLRDNRIKTINISGVLGNLAKVDVSSNPIDKLDIGDSTPSLIDVRDTKIIDLPKIYRGLVLS